MATVTNSTAHGYVNGNRVRIAGATPSTYNGDWVITKTGANTFIYTVTGLPSTPATGTITAARLIDGPPDTLDSNLAAPFFTAYGRMSVGDYIGPWVFNELKTGINLLVTAVTVRNAITFEYT